MKTRIYYLLLISILCIGCKSDKKEIIEEPVKLKPADTITEIVVDTIPEIIEDSIIEVVVEEKKPTPKPKAVTKPKKTTPKSNFFVDSNIKITPIEHATMVIEYQETTIFIDPVGGKDKFANYKSPNFILITDIHGDHLDIETLNAINTPYTVIIGSKSVKEKLPSSLHPNFTTIFSGLSRGFSTSKMSLDVEGVAMYNLREEAKQYHPKGRGLGFVLTINNKRIYISGDTEDTFEMRQLKNIDIAFVCMNLPYTMTVDNAASAVLDFKPKIVLPYHYRGANGLSDVKRFKRLVNAKNGKIKVVQLNWYN